MSKDDTPEWAYNEDGYCVCCGNGNWKYHMPECELRNALDTPKTKEALFQPVLDWLRKDSTVIELLDYYPVPGGLFPYEFGKEQLIALMEVLLEPLQAEDDDAD